VQRADGAHYFAVAAGTGFDAQLMASTGREQKRRWKLGAYLARAALALPSVRSAPHRVTVDGTAQELRAAMLLVLNCGQLPPGFLSCAPISLRMTAGSTSWPSMRTAPFRARAP